MIKDQEILDILPFVLIDSPLTFGSAESEIDDWIKTLDKYPESPEKNKALEVAYDLKNRL